MQPNKKYVLDGLRYPETLNELRKLIKCPVTVIYIETTIDSRYNNYISREDRNLTFDGFLQIIDHPVENEIQSFLPEAQIVVYNQETLPTFQKSLQKFIESELGPPQNFLWVVCQIVCKSVSQVT